MKRKIGLTVLALLLAFSIVPAAFAGGWGGGPIGFRGTDGDWVPPAQVLDLTDEQSAQIQQQLSDSFKKSELLLTELRQKMFELRSLGWQKGVDQSQLEAKQQEVLELREQMYQERVKSQENLKNVLTDEQLAELDRTRGFGHGRRGFKGGFAAGGIQ